MITHEQELLAQTLQRWVREEPGQLCEADERIGLGEGWKGLEEMGIPWLGIPERSGGSGGTSADAALAVKLLAASAVSLPVAETALIAGPLLADAGIQVPNALITAALGRTTFTAEVSGDQLSITGNADRVPWAADSNAVVVLAQAGNGWVVAALATDDLEIDLGRNLAGEPRDDVKAAGVAVPASWWARFSGNLVDIELRAAAARSVALAGSIEAVLARTVRHASEREQFGRSIGSFQAVQHHLARIAGATASAQAAAEIARRVLAGGPIRDAAMAKIVASEAASQVAGIAHQVHGAIGLTREHQLHRHTLRLWSWRDEYGSDTRWARWLGEQLCEQSDQGPWEAIVPVR